MMVRIQNKNLKNSLIITQYGQYSFDSQGRSYVPEELARELVTLNGFVLIDENGNPISFPDEQTHSVTLESGVVWESIESGYVATDGDKSYTVSGSGLTIGNTKIVPLNVAVKNGTISLSPGIDVTNIHVLGVANNDTIYVGDIVYRWEDTDDNLENGYELVQYIPPAPEPVTLPSGVVAESIESGYTLEDSVNKVTISGSAITTDDTGVVPTNVTLTSDGLAFASDIDTENLHVAGVTEGDSVTVGDKVYVWADVDGNTENGYELKEYTEPEPPEPPQPTTVVTLPSGVVAESIESGYTLEDNTQKVTISGSAIQVDESGVVPTNVTLTSDGLAFDSNIDVTNLHVAGVTEGDSVTIGDKVYIWTDVDGNAENGLELQEYVEPQPPEPVTVVTLPSGVVAESIESGYTLEDSVNKVTISGSAVQVDESGVVPTNVTLTSDGLAFDSNIDVTNLHVAGVTEGDSVTVGDKVYVWSDLDGNTDNGYELKEYTEPEPPEPTTVVTLPSGVVAESIESGYTLEDSVTKVTISGSAVQVDESGVVPTNVTLQGGSVLLADDIDTENLHVAGVTEGDSVTVGDKVYVWTDVDGNAENGYELQEYVEPEPPEPEPVTLPSGVVAESIESGYTLEDNTQKVTISGSAVQVDESGVVPTNVTLTSDGLTFDPSIDTENLHVAGVTEGDSVTVGDKVYVWTDVDGDVTNGYELQEYVEPQPPEPETKVTLESGVVWESISGGYVAEHEDVSITISGSAITTDETGVVPTNVTLTADNKLELDPTIDLNDFHVLGVSEGGTVIIIGDKTYIWKDTDNNPDNGYELVEYTEPQPPEPTTAVTLPSGVVAESIESGYTLEDNTQRVTISGSAITTDDTGVVPTNVTLTSDGLTFDPNIDTANLHVAGVTEGDSVTVGDKVYVWTDLDNNTENGYELQEYTEPQPPEPETKVTLESGVVWESISGGYIVSKDDSQYTVSGNGLVFGDNLIAPENVTLVDGTLQFSSDTNITDLHAIGVAENDSVTIGDKVYIWTDVDGNAENGLELQEYVEPQPPEPVTVVTLPSGVVAESIESGYTLEDSVNKVTISGSAVQVDESGVVPTNVILENGDVKLSDDINTANLHVAGVTEGDSVAVGDKVYVWADVDGDTTNGYELQEYIEPQPPEPVTVVTLPSGVVAESIESGYTLEDSVTKVTLNGSAITTDESGVVPTNVTLTSDGLAFDPDIDTENLHVLGVTSGDTIAIGDKTYIWSDVMSDDIHGLELKEYITKVTLPSGVVAESIESGYTLEDSVTKVTISGTSLHISTDKVTPTNVTLQGGKLLLADDIDTQNLHVAGVTEGDSITTNNKIYIWADVDNNPENGYELVEYIEPEPETRVTLEGGVVAESIESGYTLEDSVTKVTISGSAVQVDESGVVPTNVTLQGGSVLLADDIDTENLHVAGVTEGDSVTVGDKVYVWTDVDDDVTNGYELKEYTEPEPPQPVTVVTLPSGVVAESIESGYTLEDSVTKVTISGSAVQVDESGVVPTNVTLTSDGLSFDPSIDTANLHVAGVTEGDSVTVGDKVYVWSDVDNNTENGYELKEYTEPEPPQPEAPTFSYDFDDVAFTLTGGMSLDIDAGTLNEHANISPSGLSFDSDIISSATDVHIQGLTEGTKVTVNNKVYELHDTDNNLENGFELEEPEFAWTRMNQWKPYIWKCTKSGADYLLVIGSDDQPTLEEDTVTITGESIKTINNMSEDTLVITGDISGILTGGVYWDVSEGIKGGLRTPSHILLGTDLYLPKVKISGVLEPLNYTFEGGILTIYSGKLDIPNVVVYGKALTTINYKNRPYYVNVNSGKLVPNAWQRK